MLALILLFSAAAVLAGDRMHLAKSYLDALQSAERFDQQGDQLLVYGQGSDQPLRFARQAEH